MAKVPNIKLNNGLEIPAFGLGTWKSKAGEVEQAVKDAIDIGYRHIDCAHVYGNEKEVGTALKEKICRRHLVEKALRLTLQDLGLEYLDLYLIHWPHAYKKRQFAIRREGENFPFDANGKIQFSDVDYVDTWKALEKCVNKGLTKSIGVSNFNKRQLERVLEISTIKPVVNQVECHPYLNQRKLIEFCRSKGIVITGYSPLGSPDRPWAKPEEPQLLEDPKLKELAVKYKKTPAQIVLRYQVDRGVVAIPKSVTKSRIQQNFDIFDFSLTADDVAYLDTFDVNGRFCPMTR
ncbi:hypothetical protein NQ314_002449 [Rhamnusium bicolor]|uniref:NADP-dependent oxidoreductase domain-containing protein n=1 Tax=Rhamnusium bicolor TaxID=1586634 RepID=A0AAV8ZRL5_9CUCU|nr:hypothetical protein NQ314_002449 [Rhamnusium bicolor]